MPTSLAIVLGIAGAVLIIVGAIGGGFTISATSFPRLTLLPRIISFVVGAGLLTSSIFVFNQESKEQPSQPLAQPGGVVINMQQSPPSPAASTGDPSYEPITAPITAPDGYDVKLRWGVDSTAPVVASLPNNYPVKIICTAEGQTIQRPDGVTSSLWDGVAIGNDVGGFVPDVYVYTGSTQPMMPNCAS